MKKLENPLSPRRNPLYRHFMSKRFLSALGATLLLSTPTQATYTGTNFTYNEAETLKFLQERGIKDKAALSTILGNIKQESQFKPLVCEGGKLTGYRGCYTGGFGLVQWTTVGRYDGLGLFSRKYGLNPDTLEAQLRWMVNEREWLRAEPTFKTEGLSINEYNKAAYGWLGWGKLGKRLDYARTYYSQLKVVE